MDERDLMTDEAKLIAVVLRDGLAHHADWIAEQAGVEEESAKATLARMADDDGDPAYPVLRRRDLGPDYYEATEDSDRTWSTSA